jgi:outer membrane receptor protein involved in Fe transport
MKTSRKLLSRAVLTGLGILCQAGAAFAQDSAPLTIEEILITADFRSSADLDIASSVTVMTDKRIASRGAQHIEELVNAIPNVNYSAGSNRARFFQIRGIGERSQFVAPINPSVGVLIDNVDFSGAGTIATTMDIEQVEVLRGPQGTRYGANALAGLINIRSKAATEEFDAGLKLGVADYNSSTVSAFVNGALTSSVNGRLAIEQHSSDGFYSNDFLGTSDNNARDELSARAKLAIEVTESWQLDLTLSYVDMDNGYDSFSLDNTRTTLSDEPGFDRQQSTLFAATSSWALAAADVEFIVGLAESDLDYGYDEDWAFDGIHPFGYNSTDRYVRARETHTASSCARFRMTAAACSPTALSG